MTLVNLKRSCKKSFFPPIGVSFLLNHQNLKFKFHGQTIKLVIQKMKRHCGGLAKSAKNSNSTNKDDIDQGTKGTQRRELPDKGDFFILVCSTSPLDQGYPTESKQHISWK